MFWLKSVIFRLVKISGLFWLNSVVFNTRIDAENEKIKLPVRRSYGFRNVDSMLDIIFLPCFNLKILLIAGLLGRLLLYE